MKFSDTIQSFHLADQRERTIPFCLVAVFYCMTSGFFYWKLNIDELLILTLEYGYFLPDRIDLWLLFSGKSVPIRPVMGGWVALVPALSMKFYSAPMFYYLLLIISISGLVGTSRLYLNAHKPGEIYAGFGLGFGLSFLAYYYILLT